MGKKSRTPTEQEIIEAVSRTTSTLRAIQYLGIARVGTSYALVRNTVQKLGLSTEHWKAVTRRPLATPESALVPNGSYARKTLKRVILTHSLIPYNCAECGMGPEWRGKPLVLRLDHINGERNDDRIDNLRFVCPNCDSQSPTFCGRNNRDHS
jgi:predicted RNA-binding Zn-ribbon protein involved in translation (DUF1610 family)